MSYSYLLEGVKAIAREAGAAILRTYQTADFEVEMKADNSPLTIADKESNSIICDGLQKLNPVYPVLSEENRALPYGQRASYEILWVVDPLDGTKEFIKRNGEFTVNIALVESGVPVLGVVYVPVSGEMYYATRDEGAFLEKVGADTSLHVASFGMQDEGLAVVCSRSHLNPETQKFMDGLNAPKIVSRGSSLKLMLIASGAAHLYPRIAPTMEWDTAAAQCIVEAAGGFVVEYESRQPLHYNKEDLLNPYFLAGGRVEG